MLDTKYETISSFLAGAFEKLGGAPSELVIANIKCLVDKPRSKDKEAVLNNKFVEFLNDYGIECKSCMLYRPETKGKIEIQNKRPSQLENYNGTYKALWDVHEKLKIINEEDNKRISQATNLPRTVLFEKEKGSFMSLPPKSIQEQYHLSQNPVAVMKDSLVSYRSNKYSVPKRMIGLKVNLIVKHGQLHIYYHGKIIAIHKITNNKLNILESHHLKYDIETIKEENEVILYEMRHVKYD